MTIAEDVEEIIHSGIFDSGMCRICQYLKLMPEVERKAAEVGLSSRISSPTMAQILSRNGWPTSRSSVLRHRAGEHTTA